MHVYRGPRGQMCLSIGEFKIMVPESRLSCRWIFFLSCNSDLLADWRVNTYKLVHTIGAGTGIYLRLCTLAHAHVQVFVKQFRFGIECLVYWSNEKCIECTASCGTMSGGQYQPLVALLTHYIHPTSRAVLSIWAGSVLGDDKARHLHRCFRCTLGSR